MGGAASAQLQCASIKNDYELVIRVSKQLEAVLEAKFGARGRGLHEKVTTASVRCNVSRALVVLVTGCDHGYT